MGICYVTKRRAVFLDRDGVLNKALIKFGKPYPPKNVDEVEILPGVLRSLTSLKDAGFLLIVVTNQPDVARGITEKHEVEAINCYLANRLPIDEILTCYHDDQDECKCRKPLPGALQAAAYEHRIDLRHSFMVGDRWKDIEAGKRAGCRTIFIDYGYAEQGPTGFSWRVESFGEAANIILTNNK